MNCLNCNKEVIQKEGKRERKYCNNTCKNQYWLKTHKKEPKYVQYGTYKKVLDELIELKNVKLSDLSQELPKDNTIQVKPQNTPEKGVKKLNNDNQKEPMPVWNPKLEKWDDFIIRKNKWLQSTI